MIFSRLKNRLRSLTRVKLVMFQNAWCFEESAPFSYTCHNFAIYGTLQRNSGELPDTRAIGSGRSTGAPRGFFARQARQARQERQSRRGQDRQQAWPCQTGQAGQAGSGRLGSHATPAR